MTVHTAQYDSKRKAGNETSTEGDSIGQTVLRNLLGLH